MSDSPSSSHRPGRVKRFSVASLAGGSVAVAALVGFAIYFTQLRHQAETHQKDARVQATRAMLHTLRQAILAFHTEENRFPVPPGFPGGEDSPLRSDETFKDALLGQDPIINPKNKTYLGTLPPASSTPETAAGLATVAGRTMIVDAWGTPYFLLWDANGDGLIAHPNPQATPRELRETVLVFSAGPDRDDTTWEDNVVSWAE